MPSWIDLLEECRTAGSGHDSVRRKYLKALHNVTGRNVIIYYSGWLQKDKSAFPNTSYSLNDDDKNGFMSAIHKLDRKLGLDLVLHTPGGEIGATESLVDYLRAMFSTDIRAIVPQLAMSAGTMVALACKEVVMGKHSSLGPIDPQIGGVPAHGIIEEAAHAVTEVIKAPHVAPLYQMLFAKYGPTTIGEAQKAIAWADTMVKEWLETGMFKDDTDRSAKASAVVGALGNHALTLSHGRHISARKAMDAGVKVVMLEDDPNLQDAVLSVHHACIHTLSSTPALRIIENHDGQAYISTMRQIVSMQ